MFEEMKTRYLLGLTILAIIIMACVLIMTEIFIVPLSDDWVTAAMTVVFYIGVPLLYFGSYFSKPPHSIQRVISFKGVKLWLPRLGGLVVVSIAFSLSVFWMQLFALMPVAPWLVDFFLEPFPMPTGLPFLILEVAAITILAPIVEEFVFRGVLLKRMAEKTSMWGGILISSLIFGILHADIIGAFLFGIVTSLLFLKTGNLLIPILLHILNNTIATLFMFFAPTFPEGLAIIERSDIYAKAWPNAVVLLISGVLFVWVIIRLAKNVNHEKKSVELEEVLQ